jgi:serine/threonine protein kinase/WD40 repeat protein
MTDSPCPQQDELLSYMSGQLDELQADNVSLHIDTCAICNETVSTLNPGADPLVAELQQASPPSFSAEPECAAALNAIADEPPVSSAKKSPATKSPFDLPKTIREYRLIEQIGRGGMGAVFKAEHVRLKRLVAVKVLLGDRLHDESAVARFDREMEAVGKLDHPNIVRATDAGEDEDTHYLVMELVDGPNLSQLSKSLGPIGVHDACEVVRQAAAGLQHAHEHGLVHRDIKPSNLILADAGSRKASGNASGNSGDATVKILDLGLALLRENPAEHDGLTSSGQVMGTLDYMAPEQASDTHSVDIRADIYSLGCTLYHLLAGSAPFSGSQYSTILKKMMAHAKSPVPRLSDVRSDVPAELSAILDRMLAKEPADRFATPGEVTAALHPFVGDAALPALLNRYRVAHKSVEHLDTQLQSTITPVSSALSDTIDPVAQPESASNPTPKVQTDSQLASEPFAPTIIVDAPPQSFATRKGGRGKGDRGNRRRTWQLLAACGGVLLAGIVFFVGTGEGRVEITVNHPDVKVSVDGEPHQIKVLDGTTDEYRIELPNIAAGRREIVVTRDGFTAETRHFWITRNGERTFEMRLVPDASGSDANTAVIASRNDKPDPETPKAAVVNNLGPAENILPGLIPRPATIPGIKRWNIESRAIRSNVRELAYSPDGELLACGTYAGRVRIYDTESGTLVNVLSDRVASIFSLAWSPDSQALAVGRADHVLQVWSQNGQIQWESHDPQAPWDIEWSRDGAVLATAQKDKIQFFDPLGNLVQQIDTLGKGIVSISLSPDGQRFVTGSTSGDVGFWDWTNGLEISHDAHRGSVGTVKWSPAGGVIVSGSRAGKVKLWDADGSLQATLDRHQGPIHDIAWNPAGTQFVSVDATDIICRWSSDGELVDVLKGVGGAVPQAIVWGPAGLSFCVAGDDCQIRHVAVGDTTPTSIDGHKLRLTDLEWNAAGNSFATAGADGIIRVFIRNARPALFIKTELAARSLAWGPIDAHVATSHADNQVQIWNLVTRRQSERLSPSGAFNTLYSVAWHPASSELAVGSANKSATVWLLPDTSSPLQRIHSGRVECVEWVPNSKLLVTAGDGADVQIGEPGKDVLALRSGANVVTALSCSPDGQLIAAISNHSNLDIWNTAGKRITSRVVETGALADAIDWDRDSKTLFALHSDGRIVHLGIDAAVRRDVPLHHSIPTAMSVHRDGSEALSTDNAGTIIKWSTETLDPEWVLVTMPEGESLQFSASGELLRGNHELFEREFVYVIEDETGRRHLLTPSEFEHRRSLPGDFSVDDTHADRRFAQWVLDRGGKLFETGGTWPELKSAEAATASDTWLRVQFSGLADFTDADLETMSRIRPTRALILPSMARQSHPPEFAICRSSTSSV